MDAFILSRIQFAFVISVHIIFPALSIGLASWLAFLEWQWLRTGKTVWINLYDFWVKIFTLSFGMGVVSGVVMSFQFGTNWAGLSERAGSIIGPLLSYEVLSAFFLEAGFLGVMLFGRGRVNPKIHFGATCMVALGTLISTFWILAAISWMHTPQGFSISENGIFSPANWTEIIFNPSFFYRLPHMVLATFIVTLLLIGGASARLVRLYGDKTSLTALKLAIAFGAIAIPLQAVVGDFHGQNTKEHQPAKLAAMEAHWSAPPNGEGIPLILFAIPNQKEQRNDFEISIPNGASLILTHSLDGQFTPLDSFAKEDIPPVAPIFFAFRVMAGLGFLMLFLVIASVWIWKKRGLENSGFILKFWQIMSPAGFIALLAGWYVTEIGRQPWIIYGIVKTKDALSKNVTPEMVSFSLLAYITVYSLLFGAGIFYMLRLLMAKPSYDEGKTSSKGDAK